MSGTVQNGGEVENTTESPALVVIVIGLSAGGLLPLKDVLGALPAGFPAAVVVAQHSHGPSVLPALIEWWTKHRAVSAVSGAPLVAGTIYVCPPQHHVIINPDATLSVSRRERVAYVRPSVDWLFESAAASFGERVVAVVLSGANGDGARGVRLVHAAGGMIVSQAPESCAHPEMPLASIDTGKVHVIGPPSVIAASVLARLQRMDFSQFRASWEQPFGSVDGLAS